MNKTYSFISNELDIPPSTVGDIIKKWNDLGIVTRLPGSGKTPIFNGSEKVMLCNLSEENPRFSAKTLKTEMADITNKQALIRTIGNVLNKNKLFGRVAKNKPLLSSSNNIKRFELSKVFLGFSNDKWKTVIFSDEALFETFPSHRHQIVYRQNGKAFETKNLVPTVKFGRGKLMVWGRISYHGLGNLVFVDGT